MEKSHLWRVHASHGLGRAKPIALILQIVPRARMSSSGGREIAPCLPVLKFLTFFSFTLGSQGSASDSPWQFLQSLAVLKDCNTDLDIQIGKAVFKVDLFFPCRVILVKALC